MRESNNIYKGFEKLLVISKEYNDQPGNKYRGIQLQRGSEKVIDELIAQDWKTVYELNVKYKSELNSRIYADIINRCCLISLVDYPDDFRNILEKVSGSLDFVVQAFCTSTDLNVEEKRIIAKYILDSKNFGSRVPMRVLEDFVAHLKNIDTSLYLRAADTGIEKAITKSKSNLDTGVKWLTSLHTQLENDDSEQLNKLASKHLEELKEQKRQLEIQDRLRELDELLGRSKEIKIPDSDYINKLFNHAGNYEYWNSEKEDMQYITLKSKRFVGQGDDWVEFTNGFEIIHEINDLLNRYSDYVWELDDEETNSILPELERLLKVYKPVNKLAKHINEFEFYGISFPNLFEQYMCSQESDYWEGSCISGHYTYAFIEKENFKPCLKALYHVHQELCDWIKYQLTEKLN